MELTGRDSVTDGQNIAYDKTNRQITWKTNYLTLNKTGGIYFEVQVTPTTSQIGQSLQLTGPLKITAIDATTGKSINLTNNGLTNILPSTDLGSKKGYKVVE